MYGIISFSLDASIVFYVFYGIWMFVIYCM